MCKHKVARHKLVALSFYVHRHSTPRHSIPHPTTYWYTAEFQELNKLY